MAHKSWLKGEIGEGRGLLCLRRQVGRTHRARSEREVDVEVMTHEVEGEREDAAEIEMTHRAANTKGREERRGGKGKGLARKVENAAENVKAG